MSGGHSAAPRVRWGDVALGVLAVAAVIAAVAFMSVRLRYGVDLRDEAYYSAVPYRFALGDRPFIDELNLLQLPALLVTPLVKAYVAVKGGTTGIVLFMRVVWMVFAAGIAAVAFTFLRTLMRWEAALLASAAAFVTAPFNIPSLSYNTMGMGFLAIGMLLGAWAVVNGRTRKWLIPTGIAHGLAVVAYPTLAVALVAYGAVLVLLYGRRWLGAVVAYVAGGFPVGVLLALLMLKSGLSNVMAAWRYTSSLAGYGGGDHKFARIARMMGEFFPQQWLFLAVLAVVVVAVLVFKRRAWPLLLLPALALFPVHGFGRYERGLFGLTLFSLYGLILGLLMIREPKARRLWAWGVIPAFVAAVVTAYTSSNGFVNAGIGFYPALFATAGLLGIAATSTSSVRGRLRSVPAWLTAITFAALLIGFGLNQYFSVYREPDKTKLTAVIPGGPFAGLHTLPETAAYEEQLRTDIGDYVPGLSLVLFFNDYPGPYLMTAARPAASAMWLSRSDDNLKPGTNPLLPWWRRTGRYPEVAFRFTSGRYGSRPVTRSYVSWPRYHLALKRPEYEVWVRARD